MVKNTFAHKSTARLSAIQALYQQSLTDHSPREVAKSFPAENLLQKQDLDVAVPDKALFKKLLKGTDEHRADIDQMLEASLPPEWAFDRLELLIRLILETATFELMFAPETHAHILLNEYVDIAAAFYDKKEVTFVNGLLNTLARKIRPTEFNA